jgi:hypothetical protein
VLSSQSRVNDGKIRIQFLGKSNDFGLAAVQLHKKIGTTLSQDALCSSALPIPFLPPASTSASTAVGATI